MSTESEHTASAPFTVGAMLFPGFELLDVFGPLELLGMLGGQVTLTTLAMTPGAVPSAQGPRAVADGNLADAAAFDLLLVPGGFGTREAVKDDVLIRALRTLAEASRFASSVCTGASLLARTGLLDGRRATTNKLVFDWVTTQGPNVTWIRRARWIVDGAFWTSSGVTAGMDMTLALIETVFGRAIALDAARQAEYIWNEDPAYDPFANHETHRMQS
jgi:transcriptional regulator GlxA family with amidase domain